MSDRGGSKRPLGRRGYPYRKLVIPLLFVLALFVVTLHRGRNGGGNAAIRSFSGPTMGTTYTVKVVARDLNADERDEVRSAIRRAVDEVDRSMSTYKPDSELSRFNAGGTGPFEMSQLMTAVLETAFEINAASGGAFDPTVGPLVDAWGFGPDFGVEPPDGPTIERLRRSVGMGKLVLEGSFLSKTLPDVRIDLSAIAKGFAVDRVVEALAELDFENVMVEIGGEVRTVGEGPSGAGWLIGIERPDAEGRTVAAAIRLRNRALATSGDYRNFYTIDGKRISHTIDPRTGRPVDHSLASVSVLAATCMEADAWATALEVLGPNEGFRTAEEQGLPALFIVRGDAGFSERATGGFPPLDLR